MKIGKRYSLDQSPKVAEHSVEWRRVLSLARSIGEAKMCKKFGNGFGIKRSVYEAAHAHLHDVRPPRMNEPTRLARSRSPISSRKFVAKSSVREDKI